MFTVVVVVVVVIVRCWLMVVQLRAVTVPAAGLGRGWEKVEEEDVRIRGEGEEGVNKEVKELLGNVKEEDGRRRRRRRREATLRKVLEV